jgi:predicted nicotinamide N-methyase
LSLLKFNAAIQSVTIGEVIYRLYVPDMVSVKSHYESRRVEDPAASFPYWARLWPSAIALSEFIAQHPAFITGKKVLEIAAGLGLPSLVAAHIAAVVHCTDIDADAMELAAASAATSRLNNMHCEVLNWSDTPANLHADTVLLSDVNYEPETFETLHQTIQHYLGEGATILLATPQRLMAVAFVNSLQQFVQQHTVMEVQEEGAITQISVFVLRQPTS